jgi:hypothetical protein
MKRSFIKASLLQLGILLAAGITHQPTLGQVQTPRIADFNGDGFEDLAVGVPYEDIAAEDGTAIIDAGAVNVIYGSSTGLAAARDQFFHQDITGIRDRAEEGDRFGTVLATGDFNGDRFTDLAIGVPQEDGSVANTGIVHVLFGSRDGLSASGSVLLSQNVVGLVDATNDNFGQALAAGDFDRDGRSDLAIGIPNEDAPTDAGAVIILHGSATGFTNIQVWDQDSLGVDEVAETGDHFGADLAAGDFNGDGRSDLAIGVAGEDFEESNTFDVGGVNILYGSDEGLTKGPFFGPGNNDFDGYGMSLATGNFNGDRFADLAIGAPFARFTNQVFPEGLVHILYGTSQGLSETGSQTWHQDIGTIEGDVDGLDYFGSALAAGDFNRDGRDDLAIGVPGESNFRGAVNVLYGSNSGLAETNNQLWAADLLVGNPPGASFGSSLSAADFTADGITDLAIGVPGLPLAGLSQAGLVLILRGGAADGLTELNRQGWHQSIQGIEDQVEQGDNFGALGSDRLPFAGVSGEWLELGQTCKKLEKKPHCELTGTLRVFNPGADFAGPSVVRFFLSQDAVLDDTDTVLGDERVGALLPAAERRVRLEIKLHPGVNASGMRVIAFVDADNDVAEGNETNNLAVSNPIS